MTNKFLDSAELMFSSYYPHVVDGICHCPIPNKTWLLFWSEITNKMSRTKGTCKTCGGA